MSVYATAPGGALAAVLPDGRRRHFQHGPIDLVLDCDGPEGERGAAFAQAWDAFVEVLPRLVSELPLLRAPVGPVPDGPVARRMHAACLPHAANFVTPMAAVAGAVADHVLEAMMVGRGLARAYVNNGGDIALRVISGPPYRAGMVFDDRDPALDGDIAIDATSGIGGIATSGCQGRSFSLGIAESVTALASSAAAADAAATLIANAVDADDPAIERRPARRLDPDSDLGDRPITMAVGPLDPATVDRALHRGVDAAHRMREAGLIVAARLTLQGVTRIAGGADRVADAA